jgi:hypothetical protein
LTYSERCGMGSLSNTVAREKLRDLLSVPAIEIVHENVEAAWHLGERFPVPKFDPRCPCCDSLGVIFRRMRFFLMGGPATTPYRCDVYAKCCNCSVVWSYGIVISKEMFKANEHIGIIHRKEILEALEEMDGV